MTKLITENETQAAVFEWLEWQTNLHPELRWAYAVPNGQYRPGERMEPGLKSGVPDICIPVARGGYFGLYIELKVNGRKPSDNQTAWLDGLLDMGYMTVVCEGFYAAIAAIGEYIEMEPTPKGIEGGDSIER